MNDVEFFTGVDDCKKLVIDNHLEWNLKFVDDYYSKAPHVDDLTLSPEDKLVGEDNNYKLSSQQGDLPHVLPQ